jgi:hypothetical protein
MYMKRHDVYEDDPDAGFDHEGYEEDRALEEGRFEEAPENPYEDYDCYDVVITETAVKHISVFARSEEDAASYIEGRLDSIDMEKDIDECHKEITLVAYGDSAECDYDVPLWWGTGRTKDDE